MTMCTLWGTDSGERTAARGRRPVGRCSASSAAARVLDAPCGYGRHVAATRGARRNRPRRRPGGDRSRRARRAQPRRHRQQAAAVPRSAICARPFDGAASTPPSTSIRSLGYGSEEDDLAGILTTLRTRRRAGGRVFVETAHRDVIATMLRARAAATPSRRSDGTLVDRGAARSTASRGRVETTWYWWRPARQRRQEARLDPHLLALPSWSR